MKRTPARLLSVVLTCAMLLSLITVGASAADEKWWASEVWSLETLQRFGATAPTYNQASGQYEISTPEQFLFLSGSWKSTDTNKDGKPDAPRNGSYLLTRDLDMAPLMQRIGKEITAASGEQTDGYMSPFSAIKDESADKSDGWFLGSFDGGYHTVSNLTISRTGGKYAGLFGYLGNDTDYASVKNLGLIDVKIIGTKSCGAIAGVSYGAIENCFATGSLYASENGGGLAGKVKEGLNSHITNCLSYMKVNCALTTGGIAASLDGGGTIDSCYAGGTIQTGDGQASAGGIVGSFSAGEWLKNSVALQSAILGGEGTTNADRLAGTLASESGVNLVNNFVWNGTLLTANEPQEHPNRAIAESISSDKLLSRKLYSDTLGWDFSSIWSWIGSDSTGYPMLSGFVKAKNAPNLLIQSDLSCKDTVLSIDNPAVNKVEKGAKPVIGASVIGQKADSVQVYYGKTPDGTTFTDSVAMTASGSDYTCTLPLTDYGTYYYYVKAVAGGNTLTKPYNITSAIQLVLDDGKVNGKPREIVCQVGETYSEVGINWLTDPAVTQSTVWYRKKGASDWKTVTGESTLHYLSKGWEEVQSHWATITGLSATTAYEYCVGGSYNGTEFKSAVYSFTTLPSEKSFTFMQYSDMQAESAAGYTPFLKTVSGFVDKLAVKPDFLLNTGDIVASGYKASEWSNFFNAAQNLMANRLNILLPGNHENKGDLLYQQYGARTSLPNEDEYAALEGTGWCKIGDACIVFVNSDPYSGLTGADVQADRAKFFKEQTEWAKKVYENADCTWRIIASHVGTYIVNWKDPSEYPYIPQMCDELQVDLYLNGHDHEYIRTSAKDFEKTTIGSGTTYMTCSSLGEKLDAFIPNSAGGKYAVVHKDGAAQSQQIFSMTTVDGNGIHVTAYQRGADADWSKYTVIDRFDITTSLTKGLQTKAEIKPAVPTVTAPVSETPSSGEVTTYVVMRGDCLYTLAEKFYGDGKQWRKLFKANQGKIHNANRIYIGQELLIP